VPRITDFCSCIYVLGCKLRVVRLCDSDFGITPVDDITIGITFAALLLLLLLCTVKCSSCRSQWPRGLRRRSAATRLLRSWVRTPPRAWKLVCCECCILSGRGICDELITRPEESYRLWCVVMCDLETSRMRRPWPLWAAAPEKKMQYLALISYNLPLFDYFCMLPIPRSFLLGDPDSGVTRITPPPL